MSILTEHELKELSSQIYKMAELSSEAIVKSVDSLKNSKIDLAREIIENDNIIDSLEVEIDNECIKLLVTRQPAAVHLRLVLSYLKINTDLERIADLCTNIAKETIRLKGRPTLKPLVDIPRMAEISIEMLKKALRAFSEKNEKPAEEVIEMDNAIDELNLQIYRELFSYMAENPAKISEALGLIMVSKALERIGDHVTNIAERAIYYIKGIDIRHE